ncbi:MAG: formate dehydrogenase subunit delta [Sphingorhabdus sp.]
MNSQQKLVMMANQIAANLATEPDPVAATAEHIRLYWDPRMKMLLSKHGQEDLSPVAFAASLTLKGQEIDT